jgi:molybdate transport system regulatory protein
MNKLRGRVDKVESNGQISLVDIDILGVSCTATLLEAPDSAPYMQIGAEVAVMFKETEVSVAKGLSGKISLRNRFPVTVKAIQLGELISAIELEFSGLTIQSVITSRAVNLLELVVGDQVEALVKANEIMLGEWR